jgi:hypothetical protein
MRFSGLWAGPFLNPTKLPAMKATFAPPAPGSPSALTVWWEAFLLTAVGVSAMVVFCFYYQTHTVVLNEARPEHLIEFQGHRPYQLRILVPALLHVATHFLSLPLVATSLLLTIACGVALFFVFRTYLAHFSTARAARWLALGIVPTLAICYSHRWFYLYDLPATLFATLGLLLMAQRNWNLYIGLFAIATINRESSALLVLAFALAMYKSLPRRHFALLLALQITIWLAIRGLIGRVFAESPGLPVEMQLWWNIKILRKVLLHGQMETGFLLTVALGLGLWMASSLTSSFVPAFLKAVRCVVLPFLCLMSVVGVLSETRIYGELIPFLLPPALVGLYGWNRARRSLGANPQLAL